MWWQELCVGPSRTTCLPPPQTQMTTSTMSQDVGPLEQNVLLPPGRWSRKPNQITNGTPRIVSHDIVISFLDFWSLDILMVSSFKTNWKHHQSPWLRGKLSYLFLYPWQTGKSLFSIFIHWLFIKKWRLFIEKIIHSNKWYLFIQRIYSFKWKIDYCPPLLWYDDSMLA